MWKLLFQCVRGPAHLRADQPCQDHCLVRLRKTRHGPVLILACADGAGSAPLADAGARLACRGVVRLAQTALAETSPAEIDREPVRSWLAAVRDDLRAEAAARGAEPQHLACTLLLGVVGETAAAFAQIGDGVIVVPDGDGYRPVFWPQSGEYANSTHFVTDDDFADLL